ncbi:hypothetical protein NLZ15_02610 [Atlantibacter subterranea]|uniref:hypothetical protein n=1 Tax=Atlantibacter subterraneus TaxID=255519 RepID=UPI0020C2D27F|nr:hypothetical protein [Atlantibacter subterranea]UTJ47980.1 hypothetical protein NLZ15_02610 [Atlantibacter subterranea]
MPDYFKHDLFAAQIHNGENILEQADLAEFSEPGTQGYTTELLQETLLMEEIVSHICLTDDDTFGIVHLRSMTEHALLVLTLRGLDVYRAECHEPLLVCFQQNKTILVPKGISPSHWLYSQSVECATSDEQHNVLLEIWALTNTRLAWRRDVFRQNPQYLWWRDNTCDLLAKINAYGRALPDGIAYLLANEARSIVAENFTSDVIKPSPDEWLRYSIWWATDLEKLMLSVIVAVVDEWERLSDDDEGYNVCYSRL